MSDVNDFNWGFAVSNNVIVKVKTARGNEITGQVIGYMIIRSNNYYMGQSNGITILGVTSHDPDVTRMYECEPTEVIVVEKSEGLTKS